MHLQVDTYTPLVVTLEEFDTLKALTNCLVTHEPNELTNSLAALVDQALYQSKREPWGLSELPPDCQWIRHGLQLLNFDALRIMGRPFAALGTERQEVLLARLRTDGDEHWAQFAAGKWYREMLAITTEVYMSSPDSYLKGGRWDGIWVAGRGLQRSGNAG